MTEESPVDSILSNELVAPSLVGEGAQREALPTLGFGDYERFRHLLLEYCGLSFPERRRSELELGVRQAFAGSTCTDLNDYYRLLFDPVAGKMELDRLVNAVTVNETHFFRDTAQFDALYYHVLPQLIERKRPLRTLRIWSAGCASGEEPFSIAMLLRDLLPDVDEWAITILGTDINTASLNRARQGIYGDWAFREERAKQWRLRYFRPQGVRYELLPEVQRMVTFSRLNLAEAVYPAYETNTMLMDLIICRNVTIYFNEVVTHRVVDRFYESLLDGGWLVVGHSEPSLLTYQRFQAVNFPDTVLYQRTGKPTPLPKDWGVFSVVPDAVGLPAAYATPHQEVVLPEVSVSRPERATKKGTKALRNDGGAPIESVPPGQETLEQVQELVNYGHSEEARTILLGMVQREPDGAPVCALLGHVFANLGHWQEAEQWCRRAIQRDNLLLDAYYTLALVLQHQGEVDAAIDALRKVVYVDRNYVLAHFGLADLYHTIGLMPQALKSLDNARRLLERHMDDELVPGSGGITVVRLRETVIRHQQQWSAETGPVMLLGK